MYLHNYRISIILISILFFTYSGQTQNHCDLDKLVSIKGAIGEVNDSLPVLDPPSGPGGSRAQSENRMLYFIHGLNGDETSWENAFTASVTGVPNHGFPARMVSPLRPVYSSDLKLETATLDVHIIMATQEYDVPQDYFRADGIAIGHSQGGIVGRALDRYYSERNTSGELINHNIRRFGGLVTLATPNQGAQILNNENIMRGLVRDLSTNLAAGPVSDIVNSPSLFVRLIAKWIGVGELADALLEFLNQEFVGAIMQKNMPKLTKQYLVPEYNDQDSLINESEIPDLNSYIPAYIDKHDEEVRTNLVPFYAVGDLIKTYHGKTVKDTVGYLPPTPPNNISEYFEETVVVDEIIVPISWGTLHFQLNNPNDINYFEADTADYLLAYRAHKTKNFYDAKAIEADFIRKMWKKLQQQAGWALNFFDYYYASRQKVAAQNRRDAWNKGSVFLSKFDEFYRIAIGARYSELVTTIQTNYTNQCMCYDYSTQNYFEIDCIIVEDHFDMSTLDCEEIIDTTYSITNIVWHNKDSDGVVLAESAMDIPSHQRTWEPRPLLNVTHMQVRNSIRTAQMLQTVFEGGVGDFFRTEVK